MGQMPSSQELVIAETNLKEDEIIAKFRIGGRTFITQDLIKNFPSRISNSNKKIVYNIAVPENAVHNGQLEFARYNSIPLFPTFPPNNKTAFEMREDVYDYLPTTQSDSNSTSMEWHVNFADPDLFVAYGGSLFAQDEMQVAEMPALGHLKEALLNREEGETACIPRTRLDGKGTPVLIRGIERRCIVKTNKDTNAARPQGLYGNAFGRAPPYAIQKAIVPLSPPMIVNLIAMAALGYGNGSYKLQELVDIYTTAFTSFNAARIESILAVNNGQINGDKKPYVVIHTGNWGTGAFGGNKQVMAIIQLAAAWQAKVDKIVYHTFDGSGSQGYQQGLKILESEFKDQMSTEEFLKKLVLKQFQWGVSDGN